MTEDQNEGQSCPSVKIVPFRKRNLKFNGKPRSRPFVRIDWAFIDDERIRPEDKLCWIMIRRFLNKDGRCWPTNRQIGELCGCKDRSINEKTNRLKALGWLDWEPFRDKWGHARKRYWFPSVNQQTHQQRSAGGHQHSSAGKVDYRYSYGETTEPPSPKAEESSPGYAAEL